LPIPLVGKSGVVMTTPKEQHIDWEALLNGVFRQGQPADSLF
jgi:hypothetical protein